LITNKYMNTVSVWGTIIVVDLSLIILTATEYPVSVVSIGIVTEVWVYDQQRSLILCFFNLVYLFIPLCPPF
jgi:hypothetical protein